MVLLVARWYFLVVVLLPAPVEKREAAAVETAAEIVNSAGSVIGAPVTAGAVVNAVAVVIA